MINKNRYYYRSSISEPEFRQLVRCFALDFTATSTAQLIDISARLVSSIYLKIRQRMAEACVVPRHLRALLKLMNLTSGHVASEVNVAEVPQGDNVKFIQRLCRLCQTAWNTQFTLKSSRQVDMP